MTFAFEAYRLTQGVAWRVVALDVVLFKELIDKDFEIGGKAVVPN